MPLTHPAENAMLVTLRGTLTALDAYMGLALATGLVHCSSSQNERREANGGIAGSEASRGGAGGVASIGGLNGGSAGGTGTTSGSSAQAGVAGVPAVSVPAGGTGTAGGPGGTAGASGSVSGGGQAGLAGEGGQAGGIGAGGSAGSGTTSAGSGAGGATCSATLTGAASRPQLTDAAAACYTATRYLARAGSLGALKTDNWNPTAGLAAASSLTPHFTVAANGSGTHATLQAAVNQTKTLSGVARAYILIKPGTYRELVCVDGTVPITVYGADADASKVVVAYDNYNGKSVDRSRVNPCVTPSGSTYGTSGSTTFFVRSNKFEAMNLTIANDFAEGSMTSNVQAVALATLGDQLVFQNVRLLGNQDTLLVSSPSSTTVARSYFKSSYIEGDTDFVFGRGTAVFDESTIVYTSARKSSGAHFAPSTESNNPFGFLVVNSKLVGSSGLGATTSLGRAWDDSSAPAPNGQLLIRNSEIGAHIKLSAPWATSAGDRPFSADTNRLYEYKNTGAGANP